jgi:outer membrane lipoprotein-sorting protein
MADPPIAPECETVDPVDWMSEAYRAIRSYEAVVRSSNATESHTIRYGYRKPGFVRIEFVDPHRGVVIIYDPCSREVRLWPLGIAGHAMLTLDPDNPLIQGQGGQRVDRSDIGALLENIRLLQQGGTLSVTGEQPVSGRRTLHAMISGMPAAVSAYVFRYDLWIDMLLGLPVKVESRDVCGNLIETVTISDLRINIDFPERFFSP